MQQDKASRGIQRWGWLALAAIVVLTVTLRFYRLTGRSLWLDEILTSMPAHLGGPSDVVAWTQAYINQMPVFYMFTWLLHPWGDGELILRMPAFVAGALTVPAVFLLGKAAFGTRAGLVAALMTAIVPFAVWYSQEARSYSLLMLLTTMQMYFALESVKRGSVWDWVGLTVLTTLNLYTHYLALLATAAMGVFIGIFLLVGLLRNAPGRVKAAVLVVVAVLGAGALFVPWRSLLKHGSAHRGTALAVGFVGLAILAFFATVLWPRIPKRFRPQPQAIRQLGLAVGAGAVVAFAYAPWLPTLRVFLSRPDQSLGQIHTSHAPNVADLVATLAALGLSGVLLATFCIGVVELAIWAFRGKPVESSLLLIWLGVPLLLFYYSARSAVVAIDVRYLAFLFPAAMVVIAVGVEGLARALRRFRLPAAAVSLVLVVLLSAQALTALAASYQQPKDDWRGVAQHIAAASPPGSVVLTLGAYSDWSVICLDYYFRQLGAAVTVVDGAQVNSETMATMASSTGSVWGVVIFPSQDQLTLLSNGGTEKQDFVDAARNLHVVRDADPELSATDQARALLRWELPQEPQLSASIKLLDLAVPGQVLLGPNLIDSNPVILRPTGGQSEADATFVATVQGGTDYLVELAHICTGGGQQKAYAIAFDRSGQALTTFPSGSGYSCPQSASTTRSYFAFQSPPTAATVELILRAYAPGQAQISGVLLSAMSEAQ